MKIIFSILMLLFLSTNTFSQVDADKKTVLGDFILGYDSEKSLIKKGLDINELNTTLFDDSVSIVRFDEYFFVKDVSLLFVNNTLYSVKYVPHKKNKCLRYSKKLSSTKYNMEYKGNTFINWFNSYVEIYLEKDENGEQYFIHYDSKLLKKYPQYKDKL